MRLPILVANSIRTRKLILPGQKVLIALSGGPDSVALFTCLLELSKKRDLAFSLAAAHLHHGLRGKDADRDDTFCRKLCERRGVPLMRAFVDTPELSAHIRRSKEETARIARHSFLTTAAAYASCDCVAVAHHADDRIETVLYRLCRGTGLAGLQGIGWSGPLALNGEPDVSNWIQWREPTSDAILFKRAELPAAAAPEVVRPLLACTRPEILAYLRSKRQQYCTDETNFDVDIPRNAIRNLVLPVLAGKVHPGARAALWRLAEEAEVHAEKRAWRREWLTAIAQLGKQDFFSLPVPKLGSPPEIAELSDALEVLKTMWNMKGLALTHRHAQALRRLFNPESGAKKIDLPGGLVAERRGKTVCIRRNFRARDLF
ncbi:MAG TPA: tRNA lysidine(34) synthetase TilS [Planctomycetota bacterium]|nr:tRNA lysidine(34) synthetase TilS [Planctomycetota bacterium]